jgi:DNA-binding transcriptional LysR family regulator
MDLNETLAFVTVVREGSFTAAGQKLGVPKSTLSRQVARLESRMGTSLLRRSTRRLGLTEAGDAYYQRCLQAIEAIEEAERVATADSSAVRGTLRVSMPFDLGRDWIALLLPELRRRYPELRLVIEMAQRQVDLVAEGYDVAIRGGVLADSGLIARKLGPSSLVLCATPAYLDARGRPEALEDLAAHDGIVYGTGATQGRWRLTGPDGPVDIPLRSWLVANELSFLRTAVLAGLGIGILEGNMIADDLASGTVERVLPEYARSEGSGLFAVYSSTQHLSAKVRAFVDFLAEHAPARFRG